MWYEQTDSELPRCMLASALANHDALTEYLRPTADSPEHVRHQGRLEDMLPAEACKIKLKAKRRWQVAVSIPSSPKRRRTYHGRGMRSVLKIREFACCNRFAAARRSYRRFEEARGSLGRVTAGLGLIMPACHA
ncbi:hypothetical protein NM688_g9220 [Phlebia brevispora]|uniref:Uncharacterized protein n=1 Tax=Phlebia brevispora TaxID=194682 RepID=A0ACC1RI40_9APHY|nr:hypothetical protein NM688_g9220 [Phlebia brevispora]